MLLLKETGITTCFDVEVQPSKFPWDISWTLGTCKKSIKYLTTRRKYTESCCLAAGEYQLTCDNSVGGGWPYGFLRIGGTRYCYDFFMGYQQTFAIDISGKCMIARKEFQFDYPDYINLLAYAFIY